MQLSKEEYARKRIRNGYSVRIEISVTQEDCSASLGEPGDAEQLPSSGIFNSHLTTIKYSYKITHLLLPMGRTKKSRVVQVCA